MIKVRTFERIIILDILGSTTDVELTKKGDLNALLREIDECYKQNHRQIVVNLEGVCHIDTDAVATLVTRRSSRENLTIRFYNMQQKVRHSLRSSGFLTVFQVFESQREAVQSFN